jgi:hypothetical protein
LNVGRIILPRPSQSYPKDDRSGGGCEALPMFIECYMHGADPLQGCVLYVLNHGSVGLSTVFGCRVCSRFRIRSPGGLSCKDLDASRFLVPTYAPLVTSCICTSRSAFL